jgi:hypothetical protein
MSGFLTEWGSSSSFHEQSNNKNTEIVAEWCSICEIPVSNSWQHYTGLNHAIKSKLTQDSATIDPQKQEIKKEIFVQLQILADLVFNENADFLFCFVKASGQKCWMTSR